jgi:hypothetical protein
MAIKNKSKTNEFDFSKVGGVGVMGFISPRDTRDTYAVTDSIYGRDGLRNVNSVEELHLISQDRRRAGMLVGVNNGESYYKLKPAPWNMTLSDWDELVLPTMSEWQDSITKGTIGIYNDNGTLEYFESLNQAIVSLSGNQTTIHLFDDIDITEPLILKDNININLNGLFIRYNNDNHLFAISDNNQKIKCNIYNGTIERDGEEKIDFINSVMNIQHAESEINCIGLNIHSYSTNGIINNGKILGCIIKTVNGIGLIQSGESPTTKSVNVSSYSVGNYAIYNSNSYIENCVGNTQSNLLNGIKNFNGSKAFNSIGNSLFEKGFLNENSDAINCTGYGSNGVEFYNTLLGDYNADFLSLYNDNKD